MRNHTLGVALVASTLALPLPASAQDAYTIGLTGALTGPPASTYAPAVDALRIYIDHPEGIDVDDCADASHALSDLLDANDPFPGAYSLEVSSPGLDRILRTPEHFAQFVEHRVKVELKVARDGRKRYTGMLRRTDGESIEMDVDNFSVSIRLAEISRARLAPL